MLLLLWLTKDKEVELRNEISSLEEIRQLCRSEIDDLEAQREVLRCQNIEEKSFQVILVILFIRYPSPLQGKQLIK